MSHCATSTSTVSSCRRRTRAYDSRTVLVDSASKVFWGGLRVGWVRAPRDLVMPLIQSRMTLDLGSAAFEQLVLAELLIEGGQTAAAGRSTLRAGRDHLLGELATSAAGHRDALPVGRTQPVADLARPDLVSADSGRGAPQPAADTGSDDSSPVPDQPARSISGCPTHSLRRPSPKQSAGCGSPTTRYAAQRSRSPMLHRNRPRSR